MKIALKKIGDILVPEDEYNKDLLSKLSDATYEIDIKNMDMRTLQQNKALHLWCKQIADVLNGANLYMTGVFGNEIEWTMELVKTQIVKATIKKVFEISSTTKLLRKEIDQVVDFITIAFGRKGVGIPEFPNKRLWEEEKKDK